MRRFLTTLFALAVAASLSIPAFAKQKSKDTSATTEQGQAHKKHAKKKGTTEGKKKGQEGTAPK